MEILRKSCITSEGNEEQTAQLHKSSTIIMTEHKILAQKELNALGAQVMCQICLRVYNSVTA
jgi:hypothetical protein